VKNFIFAAQFKKKKMLGFIIFLLAILVIAYFAASPAQNEQLQTLFGKVKGLGRGVSDSVNTAIKPMLNQ
jgi:DNA-binding transcriptional regulator of glucitol operon